MVDTITFGIIHAAGKRSSLKTKDRYGGVTTAQKKQWRYRIAGASCRPALVRNPNGLRFHQLGHFFVQWPQTGGELQVIHCLLGIDHALGDLIDLAGNKIRLLPIDPQFGDRSDLVFQTVDFQRHQFVIRLGLLVIRQPFCAG